MAIVDHIRSGLHGRLGIVDIPKPHTIEVLSCWQKTEWSDEFIVLMRNRLLMGRMRYGKMVQSKGNIESLRNRVERYERTGNMEFLPDIANFALIEFVVGNHKSRHFRCEDRV